MLVSRQRASWPPEKLRELARSEAFPPLTVVGPALGYGKTAVYDAIRRGDFPLEVIKFSPRRWCVRGTDLLRLVDGDQPSEDSPLGTRLSQGGNGDGRAATPSVVSVLEPLAQGGSVVDSTRPGPA